VPNKQQAKNAQSWPQVFFSALTPSVKRARAQLPNSKTKQLPVV